MLGTGGVTVAHADFRSGSSGALAVQPNRAGLLPFASSKLQFAPDPTAVLYHKFCYGRLPARIVAPLVVATGRTSV